HGNVSPCWSGRLTKRFFSKSWNAISSFAPPGTQSSTQNCRWTTSNGWIKRTSALRAGTSRDSMPPGTAPTRGGRNGEGSSERCIRLGKLNSTRVSSRQRDRKSTRLNSSHSQISYAVFCLKKKKKKIDISKQILEERSILKNGLRKLLHFDSPVFEFCDQAHGDHPARLHATTLQQIMEDKE